MAQAEGGDEENPFSFKRFIKRAGTSGPGAENEGKGGKKDREKAKGGKKSSSTSSQGNEGALPFPEEGEENPFSFKKFVRKQTLTKVSEDSSGSEGDNSMPNSMETSPDPLSLTLETPPLPHASKEGSKDKPVKRKTHTSQKNSKIASSVVGKETQKSKKKKQKDSLFSDSDTDSENLFPFPAEASQPSVRAGRPLLPGAEGEAEREEEGGEEEEKVGGWDGGMLSDSSVDSVVMVEGAGKVKMLPDIGLESEQKLSQVMADNERLKSEIETYKEKYRKEKQRNRGLTEQLSALKKKEAEETKALEDIVAKVEENLVTTTKRAVSAETAVAKLKQEVQSLQVKDHQEDVLGQTQLRQADAHSVHQHYEEILSGVRAKATFASKQLSMASMAANQSLRELMSGADTLRNVAEVLEFIDRISEVRQH